jgi:transglutaminase-like putative cysteine protease
MTTRVRVHHATCYAYDRPVLLGPHYVRLAPAPYGRTPVADYRLTVTPRDYRVHWLWDGANNRIARLVFAGETERLDLAVGFTAELAPINPFDFFVEPYAETLPFAYAEADAGLLAPYLAVDTPGPRLAAWLKAWDWGEGALVDLLVALNRHIARDIAYAERLEAGIQTIEQTLAAARGSCRDSAWLAVQTLRHLGIAARLVSGYLVQLAGNQPDSPAEDSIALHAWAEAFVPGAGWVGMDTTSGLLCGEGHIPLAAGPDAPSVAPLSGSHGAANVEWSYAMSVERL